MCFYVIMQNKVEAAERKQRQTQEELDGITQKLPELQSKCAELKAEVQRQNALVKAHEVSEFRQFIMAGCVLDSTDSFV